MAAIAAPDSVCVCLLFFKGKKVPRMLIQVQTVAMCYGKKSLQRPKKSRTEDHLKKGWTMTGHFFLLICVNCNIMIKNIQIILGMSSVSEKYSAIPACLLKWLYTKHLSPLWDYVFLETIIKYSLFNTDNPPNEEKKDTNPSKDV